MSDDVTFQGPQIEPLWYNNLSVLLNTMTNMMIVASTENMQPEARQRLYQLFDIVSEGFQDFLSFNNTQMEDFIRRVQLSKGVIDNNGKRD